MSEQVEYTGEDNGHQYYVHTEPCKDLCNEYNVTDMDHIIKRHPRIRNICFGWDLITNTEKPPFKVHNPMRVLHDVWKNIYKLDSGEYLIAAESDRILNIYVRRWLTKKNKFRILSGGHINTYPYVVVQKIT